MAGVLAGGACTGGAGDVSTDSLVACQVSEEGVGRGGAFIYCGCVCTRNRACVRVGMYLF